MIRSLSFALAAALLTAACGDDDDVVSVTEDQIVGTWTLESAEIDVSQSTSGVVVAQTSAVTTASDATVTFDADGDYDSAGAYETSTTISNAGASLPARASTVRVDGADGEWSLTGNTLTLDGATFGPDIAVTAAFQIPTAQAEVTEFVAGERMTLVTRIDTAYTELGISAALSGTQTVVLTQ